MKRFQYKTPADDYYLFGVATFFGLVSIPAIESLGILHRAYLLRFALYMAVVYVPFIPYAVWRSKNSSYGIVLFVVGGIMPLLYNFVRANSSSINFTVMSLFLIFIVLNAIVIRHFTKITNLDQADEELDKLKNRDLPPMHQFFTEDEIHLQEFDSALYSLKNQPDAVGQMLYSRDSSYLLSKIRNVTANEDLYFLEGNEKNNAIAFVNAGTRSIRVAVYPNKNSESHKEEIVAFLKGMQTIQLTSKAN
jgi:hypothetical protein